VEFALIEEQIQEIDVLVEQGRTNLNWNSMGMHATTFFVPRNLQQLWKIYLCALLLAFISVLIFHNKRIPHEHFISECFSCLCRNVSSKSYSY
jgi:hypothetical protein